MSFMPPNNDVKFSPPPAGTFIATCFKIIDIGTQNVEYQGEIKRQRKVRITWELPEELMTEGEYAGQPWSITKEYTLSSHEKGKLRPMLEAWRGKKFTDDEIARFNLKDLLGKSCTLTIGHKTSKKTGRDYAEVLTVAGLRKGEKNVPLVNEPVLIWLDPALFDEEAFNKQSEFIRAKIITSPEYRKLGLAPATEHHDDGGDVDEANPPPRDYAALDDEIPF